MVNFTECANRYISNATAQHLYHWTGHVISIEKNETTQITRDGCRTFCGKGADYYDWGQSSSTITTWILPVIGILLQAPFESNAWWKTCLAIVRWCGSPIVTLSYILWNISVTGKCAMMVDMSVGYNELPSEKLPSGAVSNFSSMRDSMYILTNMNQYTMKPISSTKEAEGLLRIVLFSKDLRLVGTDLSLARVRQELARSLRNGRRKGVVPVFISTAWFLFSLAISIQSAFGHLGSNSTAHDLAMGLLLSWLPVLILACIVDRNPVAADDIRRKMNDLVDMVCDSLLDDANRDLFLASLRHRMPSQTEEMRSWVNRVKNYAAAIKGEFFQDFAGQGRIRWHYGAAHPILCDIEQRYIAQRGREWLHDEEDARNFLVLGRVDQGLLWFDSRELWQISASIMIIFCTIFGAFVLSYFTPTVGLGCRSGGYMIYWVVAMSLLGVELAVWWLTSPVHPTQMRWFTNLQRRRAFSSIQEGSSGFRKSVSHYVKEAVRAIEDGAIRTAGFVARLLPIFNLDPRKAETWMSDQVDRWHGFTFREWAVHLFFIPMEIFNATWLIYIVMGQTFGAFVTCDCQCSIWSSIGGYMDLSQWDFTDNPNVTYYWTLGTIMSTAVMGLALIYVVIEWCLQSHISSTNYGDAMNGLKRTRQFRTLTQPVRYPAVLLTHAINSIRDSIFLSLGRGRQIRNSLRTTLVWTRHNAAPLHAPAPPPSPRFGASSPHPDYATLSNYQMRETPGGGRERGDSFTAPLVREPSLTELSNVETGRSRVPTIQTASRDGSPHPREEQGLGISSAGPLETPNSERHLLSPLDAAISRERGPWSP